MESELTEEFPPLPPAAGDARRFLRHALAGLGTGPAADDLADTLVMVVNELTTNAVLHARTEFTVCVRLSDTGVRVEVADENPRLPQPCLAPEGATSGRGLAIIDATGLEWGIDRSPHGKRVWVQAPR